MSADILDIPENTRLAQRRAADPRASAWVSANAGAGKTKVLSDRVLRLLLAGTPPGRILCLTFTKAAAAEMAIRIFDRLGRWVTLDDAALSAELAELEGGTPSQEDLSRARCLFARAVETPGGLKIETIHAFCERILHLAPFEAGVPVGFTVLDESEVGELVAQATDEVLRDAAADASPELAEAYSLVSLDAVGDALSAAIHAAVCEVACRPDDVAAGLDQLPSTLGLAPEDTVVAIERAMLEEGLRLADWQRLAAALQASSAKTDQATADTLLTIAVTSDPAERLAAYRSIFFTKDGQGPPKAERSLCTKAAGSEVKGILLQEQERLIALDEKLKAARILARTRALYRIAQAIIGRVEADKARRGALDFQDLISKTLALLSRAEAAAWVLYKLDRGIDHVLIDEAQDTNPDQWRILRLLTGEFMAGQGARGVLRTVFAVGDPKQSIYGFQGADPREFERGRSHWRRLAAAAKLRFEEVTLDLSFRSAGAVLSAVDATFAVTSHFKGLAYDDRAVGTAHISARRQAPGLVELWPTETPSEEEEPDAWTRPVDEPERTSPAIRTARRVAQAIKAWTTTGDEGGRLRSPGDILVLVRKRGPAFAAVIRALKEVGVPVAGADRLDIGEHIAVLDLVAAGRAALLPEDDLNLAAALKSPLVGLDDEDLVRIAALREEAESLADALRRCAAEGDEAALRACESLGEWRSLARRHGPFGFYAFLLGPLQGRVKLVSRLGAEAADAIDAFLCFAQSAEQTDTPSLAGFLLRFESASHQLKRDLDAARGEVRVMTVHGAKGLEAPVVVLIDGCEVLGRDPPLVPLTFPDGSRLAVWSPGQGHDCACVREAREALHERGREEHNRLLYVAMTRARDHLVIAPYRTARKETPEDAWCEMVRRGLVATARGLVRKTAPYGNVDLWRDDTPWPSAAPAPTSGPPLVAVPDWLTQPAAPEPAAAGPTVRPSQALSSLVHRRARRAASIEARLRGTLTHALLERLPGIAPERRKAVATAYLAARAPRLDRAVIERIAADALGVLNAEETKALFGPGSRAEAAVAGRVRIGRTEVSVRGQIDRLAVLPDSVLVADFKSDARPPEPGEAAPPSYVTQLALYAALLQEIYPGRKVRAFLVWTSGPRVQELAEEELRRALEDERGQVTAA